MADFTFYCGLSGWRYGEQTPPKYEKDGVFVIVPNLNVICDSFPVVDLKLGQEDSITDYYEQWKNDGIRVIEVYEAHYLTPTQVCDLWMFTKEYNIPVNCYGLKNQYSFQNNDLLYDLADSIQELPNTLECSICSKPAKIIARYQDEKIVFPEKLSSLISFGDSVRYKPLCWNCYQEELKKDTEKTLSDMVMQKTKKE